MENASAPGAAEKSFQEEEWTFEQQAEDLQQKGLMGDETSEAAIAAAMTRAEAMRAARLERSAKAAAAEAEAKAAAEAANKAV